MRFRNKFSILLVLSVGSLTYAQAPDPAGSGSGSGSGIEVSGEAGVSVSGKNTLSNAEMAAKATGFQVQAKDDLQHVLHLQTIARKDKDVIKLNCINDKLVQLKAQLNILDSASSSLTATLSTPGHPDTQRSYGEVSSSGDSIRRIRSEADTCAGEDLLRQESSSVVDAPDIVDDPTTWDPDWDPTNDDVEPPIYASPFV